VPSHTWCARRPWRTSVGRPGMQRIVQEHPHGTDRSALATGQCINHFTLGSGPRPTTSKSLSRAHAQQRCNHNTVSNQHNNPPVSHS
jgi:hypothetical protein